MSTLEIIFEKWRDAKRTVWYPMKINPKHEGYYEIRVNASADRFREEFYEFKNGYWDRLIIESALGWRGLANNPLANNANSSGRYDSLELRLLLGNNPEMAEELNCIIQDFDTLSDESKKKVLDKFLKALGK